MRPLFFACAALISLTFSSVQADPIDTGLESFERIEAYHVTLRSRSRDSEEVISYYFKKPGFVRMEFIKPFRGAVLVYNPVEKKVRLRPFPFLKFFVLTLDPGSRLIRSAGGHRVDESDIGTLLRAAGELRDKGALRVMGSAEVAGREATLVEVRGDEGFTVYGINRYLLWLDKTNHLPLKAKGFDRKGELSEEVNMDDLEIDPSLPEGFFTID